MKKINIVIGTLVYLFSLQTTMAFAAASLNPSAITAEQERIQKCQTDVMEGCLKKCTGKTCDQCAITAENRCRFTAGE